MTTYAVILIAVMVLAIVGMAYQAQIREWLVNRVLARLRRGADAAEIDEHWSAQNVPSGDDQDARDKGAV